MLLSTYLDSFKTRSRKEMIMDVSERWKVSPRTVYNWVADDAKIVGRKRGEMKIVFSKEVMEEANV